MTTDCLPSSATISDYVACSDKYLDKASSAVRELSKDLSKCKLSTDVKLYRGEKTVGMFDSVGVDKDFEKQLRQLLEVNKDKAKNMKVSQYTGRYSSETSTNLYDFLSSKKFSIFFSLFTIFLGFAFVSKNISSFISLKLSSYLPFL